MISLNKPVLKDDANEHLTTAGASGDPQTAEYQKSLYTSLQSLLNIISTILARNPELDFQMQLDLDELVSAAYKLFAKDNQILPDKELKHFFSSTYSVTTSYLARAVVNNLLQGYKYLSNIEPSAENDCVMS